MLAEYLPQISNTSQKAILDVKVFPRRMIIPSQNDKRPINKAKKNLVKWTAS